MKLLASVIVLGTLLGLYACSSGGIAAVGEAGVDGSVRADSDEIPCAPRLVLQTVCQQCHSSPPRSGAPFPLVTRTDILTMRPGGLARDLMIAQLEAERMPLPPVTIEISQRAALVTWLRGGAAAVTPLSCVAGEPDAADADADAGADVLDAGSDADASSDSGGD
jgi:hypothetical protein